MTDSALSVHPEVDLNDARTVLLAVTGELDLATSEILRTAINDAAVDSPHEIVLNLSDVTFVDSTGLRVIIAASQNLAAKGTRVCVDGLSGAAQRLLEITGVIEHLRR